MNLSAMDLNLLVHLEALLAERSVTRAARRVGLSQPAMSNALQRLRSLLKDPVLERGRDGMVPTPRALALAGPVHRALSELRDALAAGPAFDPVSTRATFTIATTDYEAHVLLAPVIARLAHEAPHASVRLRPLSDGLDPDALAQGRVDLLIAHFPEVPRMWFEALFRDDMVCIVRADHPAIPPGPLTLDVFTRLSHALTSPPGSSGRGFVDRVLAERGLTRHIALQTCSMSLLPTLVARSDLIATLPRRLLAVRPTPSVRVLEVPLALRELSIGMQWDHLTDTDPAHRWLRALILEVTQDLPQRTTRR